MFAGQTGEQPKLRVRMQTEICIPPARKRNPPLNGRLETAIFIQKPGEGGRCCTGGWWPKSVLPQPHITRGATPRANFPARPARRRGTPGLPDTEALHRGLVPTRHCEQRHAPPLHKPAAGAMPLGMA
jgi:hypothetical protein